METPDWYKKREELVAHFRKGDIAGAKREELEWFMVVLANTPSRAANTAEATHAKHESETRLFADIIQHLLVVRVAEELHGKSHNLSVWALVVAVAAALFALGAVVSAERLVRVESTKASQSGEAPTTSIRPPRALLPLQS
jgi:carbon starvation protein CstA